MDQDLHYSEYSGGCSPPEPKTREQLLQYSCQLTLDPNTAYTLLSLSEGNRKVTYTDQDQPYPTIQTDSPTGTRFCVERVCLDAVTVRWSGVVMFIQQSHIKTSAEQRQLRWCSWTQ
ncbi:stonustoxin subunit beta-like [Salmo salar]|uniref:Stonustoxin subunit beta-like n=1 Tax=Salmo salar TaxID=8030 RepID=A0ABM3EAX7_SALSA|nr:stonustoxin subunit beta-like [Salmo salar]